MSLEVFGATDDAPSLPDVRAGRAVLKKGMRGPSVRYAQGLLKVVPDDGIYGDKTFAAVKAFQKKVDIKQDGVIGKDTLRHLELSAPATLPEIPLERAAIVVAKEALADAARSAEAAASPSATVAEKQAAEVKIAAATLQVRAATEAAMKDGTPEAARAAEDLARTAEDLARAKTPEERRRAIEEALDDPKPENISFFSRKIGPVPYWGIGLGIAGAAGIWLAKR